MALLCSLLHHMDSTLRILLLFYVSPSVSLKASVSDRLISRPQTGHCHAFTFVSLNHGNHGTPLLPGVTTPLFSRNLTLMNDEDDGTVLSNAESSTTSTILLQQQAESLRAEAELMRKQLDASIEAKQLKERQKTQQSMETLLLESKVDDKTELLRTVDQVTERLRDGRFSPEQVQDIFQLLCLENPNESRSSASPLMDLLVDACGQLDCMERLDNPNKRWDRRVEQDLRRKLFALDWGIDLGEDDSNGSRSSTKARIPGRRE